MKLEVPKPMRSPVIPIVLISLALAEAPVQAKAPSAGLNSAEYGTLYVLEQKDAEILPWKVNVGYSFESGNPYLFVQGISQTFERLLGRFTWIGIQLTEFITSQTELQNVLASQGLAGSAQAPSYSLYGVFTAVPLSGHLNFFGNQPFQTELHVRLGAGRVAYSNSNSRAGFLWSVRPTVFLSHDLTAQLGFGQEFESVARLKGELCLGYGF